MIDFLRANTWCSQQEYKWQMTIPQIQLASMDFTHIEYLPESERTEQGANPANATVVRNAEDLKNLNDLGIPIV